MKHVHKARSRKKDLARLHIYGVDAIYEHVPVHLCIYTCPIAHKRASIANYLNRVLKLFPIKAHFVSCLPYGPAYSSHPHMWHFLPWGSQMSHHFQHCIKFLGTLVAPKHFPITAHITFAIGQVKNKCAIDSWSQKWHIGLPIQFVLIKLAFVKMGQHHS